jgi:hypothetical protein
VAVLHIHQEITIMKTNQKATLTDVSQQKVGKLESESNDMVKKTRDDRVLSEDDVKFVGELGWLAAAAVLVTSIAVGL